MLTPEIVIQSLASGLLMGLLYGLIAVGLALIFGLMDIVNFAHGEFLMLAMYATFGLAVAFMLDPLLSAPLVAAALFAFGALIYLGVIRFAMRAKTNIGMVQIFATFGLAIVMRGLAQYLFTPDYRSIPVSWLGGKTVNLAGIYLPAPQLAGALISIMAFIALYLLINRTDFGSVFGAFIAGILVGLVEAATAMVLPASLKSVGIYGVYLAVVFLRPRGLFGSL